MTARSPGAFILSTTFHALLVGLLFLFTVLANEQDKVQPRVLELVAGEGDNYGADVAPALGTAGGVKLAVPEPPPPKPEPVAPPPVQREPEPTPAPPPPPVENPVTPVPTPKKVEPKKAETPPKKQPSLAKQILTKTLNAQNKAKKEIAKERAEDEKRAKAAADREKKIASAKVQHIDAEGIAKGVIGGSTENKVGGAGGKALVASGPVLDRYFALLKQRVLAALERPPGVSDELAVEVSFHMWADGRISGVKVTKSSGNEDLDQAVVAAFSRVKMPEYPDHKGDDLTLTIRTKDVGGG